MVPTSVRRQSAGGWRRNQVYWRLAYCRVASVSAAVVSATSASRRSSRSISGTPIARRMGASSGKSGRARRVCDLLLAIAHDDGGAPGDARIEPVARRRQDGRDDAHRVADAAGSRRLPIRKRPAGRSRHLQRAMDARRVLSVETCGGGWVGYRELGTSFDERQCPHGGADSGVDRRDGGDALDQRAQIQARSANQDRQPALGVCRRDHFARLRRPARGGIAGVGGVDMAEQPMRRARLLLCRGAGGDDAQVAIDLRAVGIDDDAPVALRQRQRQGRLAAGGRAGDDDEGRALVHRHTHSSGSAERG